MTKSQQPELRLISLADLADVIASGVGDFRAAPRFGLVIGLMFAAAGWLMAALLLHFRMPYLIYPLAMGFALVAPFAAVGFYAVSAALERGVAVTWPSLAASIRDASRRDLRWMALVTAFALFLWMDMAAILFFGFMGFADLDAGLIRTILTTPEGLMLLVVGNLAGALIAMAVFSISVVTFPMLYDRDIDFVTAMMTSVRLVRANPATMIVWCAIIAASVAISVLTLLVLLVIVLPVIGHASWHLYRRAVAPAPAAEAARKQKDESARPTA